MIETPEAAVEDLRSQLDHAARAPGDKGRASRVTVRRLTGGSRWALSLPLRHLHSLDFSFEPPGSLVLGKRRIAPKGDAISLVRATYGKTRLRVIVEAARVLTAALQAEQDAEEVLAEARRVMSAPRDPARKIAATRAFRGVTRAIASAAPALVADAASQSSDVGVVVRALEQPGAIEALASEDPLAAARLRGLRERERLLAEEGGTLRVADVAGQLHLTRQAVNRRRQQGALLALDAGRYGFLYPAWQFRPEGTIEGLEPVLRAMTHLDPWTRQAFMLGANARLKGRRPVDLLRAGEVGPVVAAASAFGDHGAS